MNEFADLRQILVDFLTQRGFLHDVRVKQAVEQVPRHLFVDIDPWEAYANQAIKLKETGEQVVSTISQPAVVVHMLEQLETHTGQKILEIGAGSGYNAALLSKVAGPGGQVFTLEYDRELAEMAQNNLQDYPSVKVVCGDGRYGLEEYAPFQRIIATVQVNDVFTAWQDQLEENGIILMPLEYKPGCTRLLKLTKVRQQYQGRFGWPVNFVAMAGEAKATQAQGYNQNEKMLNAFLATRSLTAGERENFAFFHSISGKNLQASWNMWQDLGRPCYEDFLLTNTPGGVLPPLTLPSIQLDIFLRERTI